MKIKVLISLLAIASALCASEALAAGGDTLVVFYSRSGNTRAAAKIVQESLGGDIFELKTVRPYPADYRETTEVARKEQKENARPALQTKQAPNLSRYDSVILAAPCWWGTFPMAFATFFEANDLAGKKVAVLMTHGGSGLGRSEEDLAKYCPKAKLLKGLAIYGGDVNNAEEDIEEWLRDIGVK
ncbi:flavodoxin [Synergistes jonesii]|uniref:flavodoxin n=1 Tax=Synergistes jonesii TaxID=2754 RepID=UPI00248F196F|nr:flavodoxin [Synergistes jonesii]